MPPSLLPSLLTLIVAIGYSPGPANIFSLICSMRHGRRAALRMWLGLLAGFCVAASALAVGVHIAGAAMGDCVAYVKYAGAAYILWLAWRVHSTRGSQGGKGRGCTFLSGMAVQLTNAKILLVVLMVYTTFVLPYSDSLSDLFEAGAIVAIAGPGANLAWLLLGGALHKFFARHQRPVETVMALCLVACAVAIAL